MEKEKKYNTVKTVSFKVEEDLLNEIDAYVKRTNSNRSNYIKEALEMFNKKIKAEELAKQMKAASLKVRKNSMRVLSDFEGIHDENID
jgi:metal-responsive CopG/Arc/MetJ family transcriptional regulator